MSKKLGAKGQAINIKRKIVEGKEYMLSFSDGGKELWIAAEGMKVNNPKCSKCGYEGVALDKHHVKGRKNSNETVLLCSNCHRELHMADGYKL
jgi:ribosomal protein S27AE